MSAERDAVADWLADKCGIDEAYNAADSLIRALDRLGLGIVPVDRATGEPVIDGYPFAMWLEAVAYGYNDPREYLAAVDWSPVEEVTPDPRYL